MTAGSMLGILSGPKEDASLYSLRSLVRGSLDALVYLPSHLHNTNSSFYLYVILNL